MDATERERNFYREQCDAFGAKILDLESRLSLAQRQARQYRIAATLIRDGYRLLATPGVTLAEISERFLHIVLDAAQVDLAAFLTYLPDQRAFVINHSLGTSKPARSQFTVPGEPQPFLFANASSAHDTMLACLRQAAGTPYLAWAFDPCANLALLLGNQTEDHHLHGPFGPHSRDIVETALSSYSEITQRKQMEDALARERDLHHALMNNVPDWIFFKDTGSRFVRNNKTHLRFLGVSDQQDALGKTDFDFLPAEYAQRYFDEEQAIIQSGHPLIAQEKQTPQQDGSLLWVSETKIPLFDESGQVIGLAGVSRDITMRKEAEKRQTELDAEKQRVQILSSFIQAASHEFRTPLTTLNTTLYLLGKADDPVKWASHLQTATGQVEHISAMLEAMFLLSTLDSNFTLEKKPVNVNHILRVLDTAFQAAAAEKQQTLVLQLADDLPDVAGDEIELHRAFKQLLNNALRYTLEEGTITLTTRAQDEHVIVAVRDTGIGISAEALPRVFDRFFRADPARTVRAAGLGLPIAKRIVELHQGRIEAESTLGQGSVFTVWLPAT